MVTEHGNKVQCQLMQSLLFGRIIEVDPLVEKTCPFDCLYCSKNKTLQKTINPLPFYPLPDCCRELELMLLNNPAPDYIVIGGKGDPAICQNLSLLIRKIHDITKVPVAVISCGGLLWKTSVQSELSHAAIVLASLDGPDKLLYQHINQPHQMVPFNRYVNGLQEFRKGFSGEFWIRSTLLGGVNAIEAEIKKLAELVCRINPARIFLDTVDENVGDSAFPIDNSRLHYFADFFKDVNITIIERNERKNTSAEKKHGHHKPNDGFKIRFPFTNNGDTPTPSGTSARNTVKAAGNSGSLVMTDYFTRNAFQEVVI